MSKSRSRTGVRYAIYARTAAGGRAAVDAQVQLARAAVAGGRDGTVVAEHADENVSGLGTPGPGLAALLEEVARQHIDAVVVSDITRLGRSQESVNGFLATLEHADVHLVTATEAG